MQTITQHEMGLEKAKQARAKRRARQKARLVKEIEQEMSATRIDPTVLGLEKDKVLAYLSDETVDRRVRLADLSTLESIGETRFRDSGGCIDRLVATIHGRVCRWRERASEHRLTGNLVRAIFWDFGVVVGSQLYTHRLRQHALRTIDKN
ncbi:hypothetical protein [Lonepinella sp. BR2474]|uniref:hypothetical protein n=1 Tax=Lonepinella sp. BR2474 TaxID=3434548 RepID=UPI003F6DAE03